MTTELPYGVTPIDPDEAEGLLQAHVSTRHELDELEEANIQLGLEWARRQVILGKGRADVLTEAFLYELHLQMFSAVCTTSRSDSVFMGGRQSDRNV